MLKVQRETALKGEFSGGFAPLGYRIIDKKYVVNEAEAPAVQFIFSAYADAVSYSKIVAALAERGIVKRFGAAFSKE